MEYQVNLTSQCESSDYLYVTRHFSNGYIGRTIDTEYPEGVDYTDWGIFIGTLEECKNFAEEYCKTHIADNLVQYEEEHQERSNKNQRVRV